MTLPRAYSKWPATFDPNPSHGEHTMTTPRFTLKSGTNKGNRRIWIEGRRLLDAGLTRGTKLYRFERMHGVEGIQLSTMQYNTPKPKGKHTVAGTSDRPIIDLCGKWVSEFVGDHTHVEISIHHVTGPYEAIQINIRPVTK